VDWASAAIAAGAAIGASALTGLSTARATRATLRHDSKSLEKQLTHQRTASREDRDEARRREAYVPLLTYVVWLSNFNYISRRVLERRYNAVVALRGNSGLPPNTVEALESERVAFFRAGPTDEETAVLGAGPTSNENAATYALATALASEAVLEAFKDLTARDRAYSDAVAGVTVALLVTAEPMTLDETAIADAATAATQVILAAEKLFNAIQRAVTAGNEFDASDRNIKELIRSEFHQVRPSMSGAATDPGT
jgi:hypothetical protein